MDSDTGERNEGFSLNFQPGVGAGTDSELPQVPG